MMDDQELGKSGAVLTLFGILSASICVCAYVCVCVYVHMCICAYVYKHCMPVCAGFKIVSK